jgi:nucleoid-associated protein YgaU
MAKPYPQTGHGPLGGTEDESALAHGEVSRSDSEGDGGHEADWEIPTSPDNSPLSRILGLVLVLVLAGVFSFVAYRKYDEARRNPASQTADATGGAASPSDPPTESQGRPFAGDENTKARGNSPADTPTTAPRPAASFAHNGSDSADGFQSFEDHAPNHSQSGLEQNPQQNPAAPGRVALTPTQAPTTGNPNGAAARAQDANPFGDLGGGGSPERQPQQPPTQSEPQQQLAGGTAGASVSTKPNASGGLGPTGSPNSLGSAVTAKAPQAGAPHATPAGDDADMQNLFPNERTPKQEGAGGRPQSLAARGTSLEPTGLTRTADVQNQPGQSPPAQKQLAQTPPTQGEPVDNEQLEESRPTGRSGTDNRGVTRLQPDSHGSMAGSATTSVPTTGRAEALLASKERSPIEDESAFGNSATSSGTSPRPSPPATIQSQRRAPIATNVSNGDVRSPSASDDSFASHRSSAGDGFGSRSAASSPLEKSLSQSGRMAAGGGPVSPVGTTSDAGDYYVVQPQDNFWTISRKKYGTSRYFQALAELNKARIPDPGRMRPGMKVSTPAAEMLEERYGQFLPPGTRVQVTAAEVAAAKSAPSGFFVSSDGTPKYRTTEKDTLSDIAARHLGRSSRWIQIYEMNRDKLSSPNQLKVGTELSLPGDASSIGLASEDDERR